MDEALRDRIPTDLDEPTLADALEVIAKVAESGNRTLAEELMEMLDPDPGRSPLQKVLLGPRTEWRIEW